ncbi:fasciclin domain-containing protein [Marivirga arenosa]|uniref:Fasciclin domain-containing protein n=1 Tax=Marivirga arenosa TaxID=3059076 RepID=A0AA51N986_9BACT|nr:fasciclin domain-containing protein [Marivirga sp. ABR2-2]WMN06841.1 fasciclin domain-containing protein [Marivirga sp. ABR2-2]
MKKLLKVVVLSVFVLGLSFSVKAQNKNIVELAVGTESLSTLVTAVKAAGLVETLSGAGPFTVFAPTNAAFEALPDGVLESLLKPENKDQLVAVLTYHVIGAKVMSTDLKEGQKAKTVQGEEVSISLKGGATVSGANVAKADIKASNGVVHVIDAVVLPPSMK